MKFKVINFFLLFCIVIIKNNKNIEIKSEYTLSINYLLDKVYQLGGGIIGGVIGDSIPWALSGSIFPSAAYFIFFGGYLPFQVGLYIKHKYYSKKEKRDGESKKEDTNNAKDNFKYDTQINNTNNKKNPENEKNKLNK